MGKTVLVLVPHPDDAEFSAGGTIARMAEEGARVVSVIATDGRRGSFEHESEALARIRAQEARQAAQILGAEPPLLLGHPDLELDRLPAGALREQFVHAIRKVRPDVLIAEDPYVPNEPHPDHRAVAWAALEAVNFATLPLLYPSHRLEGLEPHLVAEKYFYGADAANANRVVDISGTMEKKIAALAAHASQMTFLVEGVLQQARLAGLDLRAVLGDMLDDPVALMQWAMQAEAAQVGQRIGAQYGEAFRYERFHPLVEAFIR